MIKAIKQILEAGIPAHFPGGQFCVIENGTITCDHVGFKALYPKEILNQGSEIYDVASLTKVISTNTLIFQLIESGRLQLETNIQSILKSYPFEDTTIHDLLIHASGLKADIQRANTLKNKSEVLEKVFQSELIYPKGTHVVYSDIGFILLGLIIETIHQKPLDVVAQEVIFKPLNMDQTSYRPNPMDCAPTEYRNDTVYQGYLQGQVHDEKSFAMGGLAGHAGMFSTALDIAKFILAMFNDQHVLSSKTIQSLNETQIDSTDLFDNPKSRALGFEKPSSNHVLKDYKSEIIMHTGFTGCNLMINLKRQTGFVLLTNAVHPKRELNHIFGYRDAIYRLFIKQWEEQK
jgi:CubicO group peptidase (beta-lactamase class C family)